MFPVMTMLEKSPSQKVEALTLEPTPPLDPIPALESAPLLVLIPIWNRLQQLLFWSVDPAPESAPEKLES